MKCRHARLLALMPIMVSDLSQLAARSGSRHVYLLPSGLETDVRRVLEAAYPKLDKLAVARQIVLVAGQDADRFDAACLAHHGFDARDWKVRPPCLLVANQGPDDFDAVLEPDGTSRAGYPKNAVVFSLDVGSSGEDVVEIVEAVLSGNDAT